MENSTKAIIIGVGLFITISVVAAVMLITGIGTDLMSSSNRQLEGVSTSVSSQLLADYDNVEMTGANVIASIKKFYDKQNFLLCVEGNSKYSTLAIDGTPDTFTISNNSYVFEGNLTENEPNITGLSSSIIPSSMYRSYIIYQKGTDTILGICFDKK